MIYVARFKMFRWTGPIWFLNKYLELRNWESILVYLGHSNRMMQVQGAETWVNRGRWWWERGLEQVRAERKLLPREREKIKERPWDIPNPPLTHPTVPDLYILSATPLFLQWTHTNALFKTPLLVTLGTGCWHFPGGASRRSGGTFLLQLWAK